MLLKFVIMLVHSKGKLDTKETLLVYEINSYRNETWQVYFGVTPTSSDNLHKNPYRLINPPDSYKTFDHGNI